MPQYSFECQACGKPFKRNLSMLEYAALQKDKNIACPSCGSKKVARVFTAPAVTRSSNRPQSGGCGPGCCCG